MWIRVLSIAGLGGLFSILSLSAAAQDPKKGLPTDVVPSTFRAYLVTDDRFPPIKTPEGKEVTDPRNRTGKIHCLVCENGLAPVVATFVRAEAKTLGADSGVVKLAKSLDAMIPKYRADKLAGFVMFLPLENKGKTVKITTPDGKETSIEADEEYPDEEVEKREEYVKDVLELAKAANVPNVPFGLAAKKSQALTAWKIKETDQVTVIVYYRMRKVGGKPMNPGVWTFEKTADLDDAKIAEILKSVETAITGKK